VCRRLFKNWRSWLCTQERWNPEVANIFGTAARYCRATVGSSHDGANPDNSTLHTGKICSFPLHTSRFVLLLLRTRRGAAATTWAPRSSTCEKQRAAPRASASSHLDNSTLHTGKTSFFPMHISRVVLILLRQRRSRGNDLGTTIKYLRKTTSGAAGIGLGTTIKYPRCTTGAAAGSGLETTLNYLRGATGNGRTQRSSTFDAQRAPPRATAWAPR